MSAPAVGFARNLSDPPATPRARDRRTRAGSAVRSRAGRADAADPALVRHVHRRWTSREAHPDGWRPGGRQRPGASITQRRVR